MNRVNLRIGAAASVAALSVLLLSLTTAGAMGAPPIGKNGVIYSCFKAKGKNKGALKVVPRKRACRKMRGWRPLSWSASGAGGQAGSQAGGAQGPQGNPGPEGKEGQQGVASQVEKSLIETVQSQATQISTLNAEVTDLTGEVLGLEGDLSELTGDLGDLEGTVGETCAQLEVLTDQTDAILDSLLGSSVAVLGNLLDVPSPPDPLGTFECG